MKSNPLFFNFYIFKLQGEKILFSHSLPHFYFFLKYWPKVEKEAKAKKQT